MAGGISGRELGWPDELDEGGAVTLQAEDFGDFSGAEEFTDFGGPFEPAAAPAEDGGMRRPAAAGLAGGGGGGAGVGSDGRVALGGNNLTTVPDIVVGAAAAATVVARMPSPHGGRTFWPDTNTPASRTSSAVAAAVNLLLPAAAAATIATSPTGAAGAGPGCGGGGTDGREVVRGPALTEMEHVELLDFPGCLAVAGDCLQAERRVLLAVAARHDKAEAEFEAELAFCESVCDGSDIIECVPQTGQADRAIRG